MPTREWSPLTTHFMVTSDSSPRTSPVDSIGEHHAASTSRDLCLALFQPGGRTVSPNYLVFRREIWGIVPENKRAWTSSDAWADSRSITKEIVNETGSPAYSFHPETLETIKRLDHDIATFYGIPYRHAIAGFWEHRNLYEWYGRSYATACAGPSFDINAMIAGAAAAGGAPTSPTIGDFDMLIIRSTAYGKPGEPAHFIAAPGALTLATNHNVVNQMIEKGVPVITGVSDDDLNAWLFGITGITAAEFAAFDPARGASQKFVWVAKP